MISIGMFIFISIVLIFMVMSYVAIKTALDFMHRPRPVTLQTDLKVFKESQSVDNKIKKDGSRVKKNETMLFEEKCVRNPVESEDVNEIIEVYSKYLKGEILDPEAEHAPSEFLGEERNPDYELYLLNQKGALEEDGYETPWITSELKRLKECVEYGAIKVGFIETLVGTYRFPVELVPYAVTDDRMESFSEGQWRKLSQAARNYLSEFEEEAVGSFLLSIDDYDKLVDYASMERYASWHDHGVPMTVSKENIMGNISDEVLIDIVRLVDEESYDWKEALEKVLQDNVTLLREEELKRKYKAMVERRI